MIWRNYDNSLIELDVTCNSPYSITLKHAFVIINLPGNITTSIKKDSDTVSQGNKTTQNTASWVKLKEENKVAWQLIGRKHFVAPKEKGHPRFEDDHNVS